MQTPNNQLREVYEYMDYREYLIDFYESRKKQNPNFSYRILSDKMGFKTRDFIHRVMKGERNLSAQSIPKVCHGLDFNTTEKEYFSALINFCQSEKEKQRDKFYEQMQKAIKKAAFIDSQHLLAHHQYRVYSDWRHLAVRSLIGMHGFNGDYAELASWLNPAISVDDAKESVELLELCGLISQDKKGKWILTHKSITTGNTTSRIALKGFHQKCIALGSESIDRDPPHLRNVSGLTLGVSKQSYDRIVEKLNDVRKEIAQIASEDTQADQVVQLELLLFHLSQK
ncbi:MAG: TIGR02147 family protein [Fibrobacter sp.]|nr:TIGR02147 family protein [Fibrobacter sp.]